MPEVNEWTQTVGALHKLLVHMPIGWLLLVCLVYLGAMLCRRPQWHAIETPLLAAVFVVSIPAIVSGLAQQAMFGADKAAAVVDHRNLMLATTAATLVALVLRVVMLVKARPALAWFYPLALGTAAALLVYGSRLGGQLTHGSG